MLKALDRAQVWPRMCRFSWAVHLGQPEHKCKQDCSSPTPCLTQTEV